MTRPLSSAITNKQTMHRRTYQISDSSLRQQIASIIQTDARIPIIDRKHITVRVLNKMVMLTGRVRQMSSRLLAYGDALKTDGVEGVLDAIECIPGKSYRKEMT